MFYNTSIHPHVGDTPAGEIKSNHLVSLDLSKRDGLLAIVSGVDQLTVDYLRRLATEAARLADEVQQRLDQAARKDKLRVIDRGDES